MKKIFVIVGLIAILVLAAPASAKTNKRAGEQLNIYYSGTQEFPAGEPYHIAHGWLVNPKNGSLGKMQFKLEVDGLLFQRDFLEVWMDHSTSPEWMHRMFVFNFSEGMAGEHTFTGHWLQSCASVYGDCKNPNKLVEAYTSTVEVTFVP